MSQREDLLKFETGRIKALQEERLHIQKKTFTKWMNSFLSKARVQIEDLFTNLADGKDLLTLLEIISGDKLGKPNNGRMRVHQIENVNKSLTFLRTKVRLESIGAEDIVDGNPRLILGLLWTIILRFQIQDIVIDVDEDNVSSEKRSAKDALLLWCQRRTNGYPSVQVEDFTSSWRSGMAFCALIHYHRPDVLPAPSTLNPEDHINNLNLAFQVAETELMIPQLLDAEDVDTHRPDEKSIMTYVSSFYHAFARMKHQQKGGSRIANIVGQCIQVEQLIHTYERLVTQLIDWMNRQVAHLMDPDSLGNSLATIQDNMVQFKAYRTGDKPIKYSERSEIEALLFSIQTQLKSLGQQMYQPPEGCLVQDIERLWSLLEKAEHNREVDMRERISHLEKLDNLYFRFNSKKMLRESYIKEMTSVLRDPKYGANLTQVEASVKKHEAICADIVARKERFQSLELMAQTLIDANYCHKDIIIKESAQIAIRWKELLLLLDQHTATLTQASILMRCVREVETIISDLNEMNTSLTGDDRVHHLQGVEDLLHKHNLIESQITSREERIQRLNKQAASLTQQSNNDLTTASTTTSPSVEGSSDPSISKQEWTQGQRDLLSRLLSQLNGDYVNLVRVATDRRDRLARVRTYFQFVQDTEEEEGWMVERQRICQAVLASKDLLGVLSLQNKHKLLQDEIRSHEGRRNRVLAMGHTLMEQQHQQSADIESRIQSLNLNWGHLQDVAQHKQKQLQDAVEAFQYHQDANEAESWMREKTQLAASEDIGKDEVSVKNLLQRHSRLEEEIESYRTDIERLKDQANQMVSSGVASLFLLGCTPDNVQPQEPDQEVAVIKSEGEATESTTTTSWAEQTVEKTVIEKVEKEVRIPRVMVLYNFKGQQGVEVKKGDVLRLKEKTNNDWWCIQKIVNNQPVDAFVPANYVKQIDDQVDKVIIQEPKIILQKELVQVVTSTSSTDLKSPTGAPGSSANSTSDSPKKAGKKKQRRLSIICEAESVEHRQRNINHAYEDLVEAARSRRENLENWSKLFRFQRECDTLQSWMSDKGTSILDTNEQVTHLLNGHPSTHSYSEGDFNQIEHLNKKYQTFLSDVSVNKGLVDQLNLMGNDYIQSFSQVTFCEGITTSLNSLNKEWMMLHQLRLETEGNIQTLSRVQLFHRSCQETHQWMMDKMDKMDYFDSFIGKGKEANNVVIEGIIRKLHHLQRELGPISDKVHQVQAMGSSLISSFPNQTNSVTRQLDQLSTTWSDLQDKAMSTAIQLEVMNEGQGIKRLSIHLMDWIRCTATQCTLHDTSATDVATATQLLKSHQDVGFEIESKKDDLQQLRDRTTSLVSRMGGDNARSMDMKKTTDQVTHEYDQLLRSWHQKDTWLVECKELMLLNQESNHLLTMIKGQMTLLELDGTGSTLDEAENLLKRHDNLMATLSAQEDRVTQFDDMATKMITSNHHMSDQINITRQEVLAQRRRLKEKAIERNSKLTDVIAIEQFKADSDEFVQWTQWKITQVQPDNFTDLVNIVKKLQKHEAFEAELNASLMRETSLVTRANQLKTRFPNEAHQLNPLMDTIQKSWSQLTILTQRRGLGLRQANQQLEVNTSLENGTDKLAEFERILSSTQLGKDLSTCKALIQKHNGHESDLTLWINRVSDLVTLCTKLQSDGHFNGATMVQQSKALLDKFQRMVDPSLKRKQLLDQSLQFHQFEFDLDIEFQWVTQYESSLYVLAQSPADSLTEAQNMRKKHHKLDRDITGHQNQIDRCLNRGDVLITQGHFNQGSVATLCKQLKDSYKKLKEQVVNKGVIIDLAVDSLSLVNELIQLEVWVTERVNMVMAAEDPKDEDSAQKLMTKHSVLKQEVQTYVQLLDTLKDKTNHLIKGGENNPHGHLLTNKKNQVTDQMNHLATLMSNREIELQQKGQFLLYDRECNNLLQWIHQQMLTASSDEYGQDYEHLQTLMSKFHEFRRKVEGHSEAFKECEQFAAKLIDIVSVGSAVDQKQTIVRNEWSNLLDTIQSREQKLIGAGEIHKFNRDIADSLSRILEKYGLLSSPDFGKDVSSVETLLRKHEGYENDLVALESQLQSLIDDSVRLQKQFPGSNCHHIQNQQSILINHWNNLQSRSLLRKAHLNESFKLHKFISSVKDLENWSDLIGQQIGQQHHQVRDQFSCQVLRTDHDSIKLQIEQRENDFTQVVQVAESILNHETSKSSNSNSKSSSSDKMVEEAKEEYTFRIDVDLVKGHLRRMLSCREALHTAWQLKKVFLDQLSDLHFFLAAAKTLDQLSLQQEHVLQSAELGYSVQQVMGHIKSHDSFMKLLTSQEDKLTSLQSSGLKLIQQNHFESDLIKKRMDQVSHRRQTLKAKAFKRHQVLQDRLLLVQFKRDITEAKLWIDERNSLLQTCLNKNRLHQTLIAELNVHKKNVQQIADQGLRLIERKHESSGDIEGDLTSLLLKVHQFEQDLDADIFQRDADQMDKWMDQQQGALNQVEVADSITLIEQQIKQHDEFEQMMSNQEEKLSIITRKTLREKERESVHLKQQTSNRIQSNKNGALPQDTIFSSNGNHAHVSNGSSNGSVTIVPTGQGQESSSFGFMKHLMGNKGGNGLKDGKESKHPVPIRRGESIRDFNLDAIKVNQYITANPVLIQGTLDRKPNLTSGGKRAPLRSWKSYYMVLSGQLILLFRDKQGFLDHHPVSPPTILSNCVCVKNEEYSKKKGKPVFQVDLYDKSQFLFSTTDETSLTQWVNLICSRSPLPPCSIVQDLISIGDRSSHPRPHSVDSVSTSSSSITTCSMMVNQPQAPASSSPNGNGHNFKVPLKKDVFVESTSHYISDSTLTVTSVSSLEEVTKGLTSCSIVKEDPKEETYAFQIEGDGSSPSQSTCSLDTKKGLTGSGPSIPPQHQAASGSITDEYEVTSVTKTKKKSMMSIFKRSK